MGYSQSWLEDTNAKRCILVKAIATYYNGSIWLDTPFYFSSTGYMTTDASVVFQPIITGGLKFDETLSSDGNVSVSFGDVELYNVDGSIDIYLDSTKYIWVNRAIEIYHGDPGFISANWAAVQNNFTMVFNGIISDIASRARDKVNFLVKDKMELLNAPITDNKLGTYGTWAGGQSNQDTIKPLIFGEVHNVEPLLIDPSILEYMYNDGASERLIEIRDNGVPIWIEGVLLTGATVNNTTSKFTLTSPPSGTITCSLQGTAKSIDLTNGSLLSVYNNNIANLVALIITQYGKDPKLTATDLDLTNLNAFATSVIDSVGIVISSRENLLNICEELTGSVGAQIFFNRIGQLQILRLGVPTTDASVNIETTDILQGSLSIVERSKIVAATKLGYAKNWTVQEDLLTAIPQAHKDMFATEWLTITIKDIDIATKYKLTEDPTQKDTMLIVEEEAAVEALRLNNYYKVTRTRYKFTGTSRLLSLKLGQAVNLKHTRYGLSAGVNGQVVGLSPDWSKGLIDVEVVDGTYVYSPSGLLGLNGSSITLNGYTLGLSL